MLCAGPGHVPPLPESGCPDSPHRRAPAAWRMAHGLAYPHQAGRAELKTSQYSPEAPITPFSASAAAASPAVAALRLAASAFGSCHTVSLIKRPEAQSAYSSAAQKPLASASRGTRCPRTRRRRRRLTAWTARRPSVSPARPARRAAVPPARTPGPRSARGSPPPGPPGRVADARCDHVPAVRAGIDMKDHFCDS